MVAELVLTTTELEASEPYTLAPRRFTVEEYELLAKAGVLADDEKVELIEGELIQMSPINLSHVLAVNRLNFLLAMHLAQRAIVSVQNPVRLAKRTMPQPDIALWRHQGDGYRSGWPGPEDILLIIEVADSSVEYDRRAKSPLYARAGIQEYWIVNLPQNVLEVYRQPREGSYRSILRLMVGDTVDLLAFPDVTLSVGAILGTEPLAGETAEEG
jgi:Uma2 family endonuclease